MSQAIKVILEGSTGGQLVIVLHRDQASITLEDTESGEAEAVVGEAARRIAKKVIELAAECAIAVGAMEPSERSADWIARIIGVA
jgi:hypothetical protein